ELVHRRAGTHDLADRHPAVLGMENRSDNRCGIRPADRADRVGDADHRPFRQDQPGGVRAMARLEIDRVTKRYGDVHGLRGLSLDVADGEFVVLLGPSGCGKTTTLRVVAGFAEPTCGAVRFGDRDVTRLPPWKRNAGLVFQSYALFPHLTVARNVAFGLEMRKVEAAEMKGRGADALRLGGLEHLGER